MNSHHLLWNSIQVFLLTVAESLGYKTPVPFETFGILLNCTTLLLFYVLLFESMCKLFEIGRNRLFAIAAVILVAFSLRFWYLGFQNQPYPLMFLATVGNNDWYGNMNYDLLFTCLQVAPRNPGLAIVNYFVLPAAGSPAWETKLRQKIDATLSSGGRVFVAQHVFDPDSYKDLAGTNSAFDPYFSKQNLGLDGAALQRQVKEVFAPYNLEDSDFKIGDDDYFVLRRK